MLENDFKKLKRGDKIWFHYWRDDEAQEWPILSVTESQAILQNYVAVSPDVIFLTKNEALIHNWKEEIIAIDETIQNLENTLKNQKDIRKELEDKIAEKLKG